MSGFIEINDWSESNSSIDVLVKLYEEEKDFPSQFVRVFLAKSVNTPLEILIELSKDKNQYIRNFAQENRINRIVLLK